VSVLSVVAVGRLAERIVRKAADEPMPVDALVTQLEDHDIDIDRARAGVALATLVDRLEAITDEQGKPCVRIPTRKAA
jgi:hypothetical protein